MKENNVITSFVYGLIAHVINIKAIYSFCEQLIYIVFHLKEACDILFVMKA